MPKKRIIKPKPKPTTKLKCRHCKKVQANRPRQLCWSCYYKPEISSKYPVASKYGYRGVGLGKISGVLPEYPTTCEPGTPEKLEVMRKRASRHESLFHPDDIITISEATHERLLTILVNVRNRKGGRHNVRKSVIVKRACRKRKTSVDHQDY